MPQNDGMNSQIPFTTRPPSPEEPTAQRQSGAPQPLEESPAPVTGILLAGGSGTRFDPTGGMLKLLRPLPDGRPIIRASCEAMLAALDRVTVVCHHRTDEIRAALSGLDVNLVHCPDSALGMGASIRCGVRAALPGSGWLIALGDMPYVAASTVNEIVRALLEGALIARPFHHGTPGHPVGFSSRLAAALRDCDPRTGLKGLIQRHRDELVRLDTEDPGCTRDIDVPADIR